MFKKGDIVMITGTVSVFSDLLGAFGVVKYSLEYKSMVLFKAKVKELGSMAHTVLNTELIKIGESDYDFN
ncbi:MAG: hypothetical protein ACRCVJ_18365 [Clostridium sp.]|uniref:hypothetical protein n=1 Tax=Clostridium sp. TaxID=1506 RepID=UPI003F2BF019